MLSELVQKALVQWRGEGIKLLPPLNAQSVISMLSLTRQPISKDVVELYCTAGGMMSGESDKYCWSLWPLESVIKNNATYTKPYVLFADFLIHSHLYCFDYENENVSAVCIEWCNGKAPQRVANSLEEFFDLYLKRPKNVDLYVF